MWAVGSHGAITHFDGHSWTASSSGTTENLTSVSGTKPNDVWASGDGGTVFHWDGATWKAANAVPGTMLLSVWASSPKDVWAAGTVGSGESGSVRHWDGAKWDETGVPGSTSVWQVSGTGPKDVWLVGGAESGKGLALHSNGTKFDTIGYDGPALRSIYCAAPKNVWVAPYQGPIEHWNGSTWASESTTSGPLLHLTGTTAGDVWAVGYSGASLHRSAGAKGTWATVPTGSKDILWSIWGSAPNVAWAVGNGGARLKWDGAVWASK